MRTGVMIVAAALLGCSESGAAPARPRSILPKPEFANPIAPAPEREAPAVALDGEGLRLVLPETGATRPIPFGTGRAQTTEAASPWLGKVREVGRNPECGEGPLDFVAFESGLTLWFRNGVFSGWSSRGAAAPSTMDGLKVGLARKAFGGIGRLPTFERSTLGEEFDAGGVRGVMSGPGPAGVVETLWAGTACVFR